MASPPDMKTAQGYEQQLGVNVIGHFLLTKLLLPTMISTAEALKTDPAAPKNYNVVRVVNTSSNGHIGAPSGGFNYDSPNNNSKWANYGQSKWCNIVHANEIARRYGDKGISAHSLNPGAIKTELARYSNFVERALLVSLQPLDIPFDKIERARTDVPDLSDSHTLSYTNGVPDTNLRWSV